ncbi:MAG: hypothetical protein WCM93_16525 [Bacteroidota bacterium]
MLNSTNSLIRPAYSFKLAFLNLRYKSKITRSQVFFLCYLIESEFTKEFRVKDIVIKGLPWTSGKRYLMALRGLRFTAKHGRLWSLTEEGRQYHATFMKGFDRAN